jgi:predicted esterase
MVRQSLFITILFLFAFGSLLFQSCKNITATKEHINESFSNPELGGMYHDFSIESQVRGLVDLNVYLPPGWSQKGYATYPLLFFLHGGGGNQYLFSSCVPAAQLNQWITEDITPPLVIVSPKGWYSGEEEQWYSPANQIFLTSENSSELRLFCKQQFRAGVEEGMISIQGFSRGASGTLYLGFKYSDRFASAISNSFVSLYILEEIKDLATNFRETIIANNLYLRILIGDQDRFITEFGWNVTPALHDHLEHLGILHDYEVFPSVDHAFPRIWNYIRSDGLENGLYELKRHAQAWGMEEF